MSRFNKLILPALLTPILVSAIPDPIICEDTLDGSPPFNSNKVPCLLGCGVPVAVATGSLLPGSVNETDIPYCQLNCVQDDPLPAMSSAAPTCYDACKVRNQATPENVGWCMFWCVEGWADLVRSTACVPSLEYGSLVTTVVGRVTVTERPFTEPSEWASWYLTQTVLSKPSITAQPATATDRPLITAAPETTAASVASPTGSEVAQQISTPGSAVDADSAADSTSGGQNVVSATPTGSGCMTIVSLLPMLGVVGVIVMLS
ncbi:hypothetical protein ABKA04_001714 [Annulohypoxylon sp. FPYF3050]